MTIQLYTNHTLGVDLYINNETGAVFTSIRGAAVICQVAPSTIQRRLEKLNDEKGVALASLNEVTVQTPGGLQGVAQIDEDTLLSFIGQYNPALLAKCAKAGLRVFLHGLVGIEYTGQSVQPTPPPPLPPADVRLANFMGALKMANELLGMDFSNPRLNQHIKDLVGDKILGAAPANVAPAEEWLGVAEKAERMGYPVALVTAHRSQLGKWVKAHSDSLEMRQENRLCNGTQRPIYLYRNTARLACVIAEFLDNKMR